MWLPGSADTVFPRPSVTLTFDRLTLKLVCKSHLLVRWEVGNPHFKFGHVGLWVLELFAMYVTDRQTDRRMDKSSAYCPIPYSRDMTNRRTYLIIELLCF